MVEKAGIREVKKSLSYYIRKVKKGETITITERGIPVARLSPVNVRVPENVLKMVDEGLASYLKDSWLFGYFTRAFSFS